MTLHLSCVLLAARAFAVPPLKEHIFALSAASPRGEIHDCWAQREHDAYPPASEALRSCCLPSDADRLRTREELKVRPLHFPRSYVELAWQLVNRTARDLDFNFVGRIDARPVKAARQFVPGFAKRHFTARSYYAESRPTRSRRSNAEHEPRWTERRRPRRGWNTRVVRLCFVTRASRRLKTATCERRCDASGRDERVDK